VAGQRRGAADERNLWPDTLRVIRDVGPRFVLLENVPGILANGYGGTVVGQLSDIGYDCIWDCVPAASVGAPHLRWRWWCLAIHDPERHGLITSEVSGRIGLRTLYSQTGEEEPQQFEGPGIRRGGDKVVADARQPAPQGRRCP